MREFLLSRAEGDKGKQKDFLSWEAQCEAARRFDSSLAQVEEAALSAGLLPMRYRRNRQTLSIQDQLQLFRSRVAIIGCGGLGGYHIEQLARLGVGTLVLVDPDVFEEHNLNRQLLSSLKSLGKPKVEVGRERVAEINPAVTTVALRTAFCRENGPKLLYGSAAVVDGLDNALVRRELADVCREMSVPMVHGAIAGWYGQVAVQMPGDDISPLFGRSAHGMETVFGNPAFTPAVIASLQVAEVTKILLGRGGAGKMLFVDLSTMAFETLPLWNSGNGPILEASKQFNCE